MTVNRSEYQGFQNKFYFLFTCVKTQEYLKVPEICQYLERGERRLIAHTHTHLSRGALISPPRAKFVPSRPNMVKILGYTYKKKKIRGPLVRILHRGTLIGIYITLYNFITAELIFRRPLDRRAFFSPRSYNSRELESSSVESPRDSFFYKINYTQRASSAQQQQQHAKRKDVRMYLYVSNFSRAQYNRAIHRGVRRQGRQSSGRRRRRKKDKKTKCKTPKRLIPRYDDLAVQYNIALQDSSETLCSPSSFYTPKVSTN
uniref:Uncharacterized protein n=1 Tax=Trichogramma kaykai TaxID=54128 RepID=A0ABD2XH91_9HYME